MSKNNFTNENEFDFLFGANIPGYVLREIFYQDITRNCFQ